MKPRPRPPASRRGAYPAARTPVGAIGVALGLALATAPGLHAQAEAFTDASGRLTPGLEVRIQTVAASGPSGWRVGRVRRAQGPASVGEGRGCTAVEYAEPGSGQVRRYRLSRLTGLMVRMGADDPWLRVDVAGLVRREPVECR